MVIFMNRETFRQMLIPLTAFEKELQRTKASNALMNQSIRDAYKKDENGYYFFTNQVMAAFCSMTKDPLHATLSHSILKNKLRLIIHARFSKIPFHYDEFISVNYVYSGKLKLQFPDSSFTLHKGQLFLMNTDIVHSFEIESEDDLILGIQIEKEFLNKELLYGLSGDSPVTDFLINTLIGKESSFSYLITEALENDRMQTLFEDLFCEYFDPSSCSAALVENYVKIFFILLIRTSGSRIKTNTKADLPAILNYIETHSADCSLHTLSEIFHFHPKYLSALIKKKTGHSFLELQTDARMRSVCYYLEHSDLTIREIAEKCGYTNLNSFYEKFRERYGMNPKEFRTGRTL